MKSSASPSASEDSNQLQAWLNDARGGSNSALGRILEASRGYMLLVANREIDSGLRQKAGASDLVQETCLDAQRDFAAFRGTTEREFFAWLTQILINRVRNAARHYRGTQLRDINREVTLERDLDQMAAALRGEDDTPSALVAAWEEERRVRECLDRMSEAHRRAIILRNWEGRSFAEIGEELGRSADAARKLWVRAVERLGRELEDER